MSTETSLKRKHLLMEAINFIGLSLVGIGTVLILVGYFLPREYTIDPDVSARENERRSFAAASLARKMDICIITGTVCIGVGGIGVLLLMLYSHFSPPMNGESDSPHAKPDSRHYGSLPEPDARRLSQSR